MILKKLAVIAVFLFVSGSFVTCGIKENYFLPQVPETNIARTFNTNADIILPAIPGEYYYAGNYAIFYRIYLSNYQTESSTETDINQISSSLASDYRFFNDFTNPANTSSIVSLNTFNNRNYFELEFDGIDIPNILPKNGGTVKVQFPTSPLEYPVISLNDGPKFNLRRPSQLVSPETSTPYFLNTAELGFYNIANNIINADVSGRSSDVIYNYAYVSMYIVAVGTSSEDFSPIYSKPTHVSVFRLP